jgi:hypothetical protein
MLRAAAAGGGGFAAPLHGDLADELEANRLLLDLEIEVNGKESPDVQGIKTLMDFFRANRDKLKSPSMVDTIRNGIIDNFIPLMENPSMKSNLLILCGVSPEIARGDHPDLPSFIRFTFKRSVNTLSIIRLFILVFKLIKVSYFNDSWVQLGFGVGAAPVASTYLLGVEGAPLMVGGRAAGGVVYGAVMASIYALSNKELFIESFRGSLMGEAVAAVGISPESVAKMVEYMGNTFLSTESLAFAVCYFIQFCSGQVWPIPEPVPPPLPPAGVAPPPPAVQQQQAGGAFYIWQAGQWVWQMADIYITRLFNQLKHIRMVGQIGRPEDRLKTRLCGFLLAKIVSSSGAIQRQFDVAFPGHYELMLAALFCS